MIKEIIVYSKYKNTKLGNKEPRLCLITRVAETTTKEGWVVTQLGFSLNSNKDNFNKSIAKNVARGKIIPIAILDYSYLYNAGLRDTLFPTLKDIKDKLLTIINEFDNGLIERKQLEQMYRGNKI